MRVEKATRRSTKIKKNTLQKREEKLSCDHNNFSTRSRTYTRCTRKEATMNARMYYKKWNSTLDILKSLLKTMMMLFCDFWAISIRRASSAFLSTRAPK